MTQAKLFDSPSLPPIARADDVPSSKIAAEKVTTSGSRQTNCKRVLTLVQDYPLRTSKEYASLTWQMDRYEIARRLADLEHMGKVRKAATEPGKKKQILWEAV